MPLNLTTVVFLTAPHKCSYLPSQHHTSVTRSPYSTIPVFLSLPHITTPMSPLSLTALPVFFPLPHSSILPHQCPSLPSQHHASVLPYPHCTSSSSLKPGCFSPLKRPRLPACPLVVLGCNVLLLWRLMKIDITEFFTLFHDCRHSLFPAGLTPLINIFCLTLSSPLILSPCLCLLYTI